MGRIPMLQNIMGVIKDKASQSKAAILSKPNSQSLQLTLLRVTTHDPFTPPNPKHLATLLSFGHSSRATASAAIEALMDRLQNTQDSFVALKCLIAVHHIIKHGSFILQDQLSVYPSNGGRNNLKLSNFRDNSSPVAWELSSWVRWYAEYIETLLFTSRILGFFLVSSSNTAEKVEEEEEEEERISAIMNNELIRETKSLVGLIELICKKPETLFVNCNKIVDEINGLVGEDRLSALNEIWLRVGEFRERLSCLSFGESVEIVRALKRLEDCKGRRLMSFNVKKDLDERFWSLVHEIKEMIGEEKGSRSGMTMKAERLSESGRFGYRVVKSGDPVQFSSERFIVNLR